MILQRVLLLVAFFPLVLSCGVARAGDNSLTYDYYLNEGIAAFKAHRDQVALDYFNRAHFLSPAAEEPLEYINLLKRVYDGRLEDLSGRPVEKDRARVISDALDHFGEADVAPQPGTIKPAPVAVAAKPVKRLDRVTIDDILGANPAKPSIRLDTGSSVVIEGKDILRFLVVDPGFFTVKAEGRDQIRVEGLKWGSSFLHVWDQRGRTTLYVEVFLPHAYETPEAPQTAAIVEHAPPFRMRYTLDNGSFYSGRDMTHLRRGSSTIQESVAIDGETPYGALDASLSATGFDPIVEIPTYTLGLSHIPLKGTDDLNARVFDGYRSLSPLTLPGARLRGEFVDVRAFENMVGVSLSHGGYLPSISSLSPGLTTTRDSFIDAVSVSLFPVSTQHRYTLNYATGYGTEREPYLTRKVYSLQGEQKAGPFDLNAELARDDRTTASLAGIKWANGLVHQGVNFRNINKEFTTITASPSNQGEIGATWTTNTSTDKFSAGSFVDVYQDRLYPNADDPQALNYDTNAHIAIPLGQYSWDTSGRYVTTPGQASPRTYAGVDTRLSRGFPVWGGRRGTGYIGASDQLSRFEFSPASEYDRNGVTAGVQVPLTRSISGFANYEYSWLYEKLTSDTFHPAVMNAGLAYNANLTENLVTNLGLTYRNELNVKGANSFLAGEDSVAASAGLTYTPKKDVTLFCDSRMRSVWSQVPDGPSYNDLDLRFGMRMAWGLGLAFDPQGTVAGFVFKDRDGNKEFTPDIGGVAGDEGLPGIKVRIGDQVAVTDARGWFSMPVRARRALVAPVMESLPQGFVFSTAAFAKVDITQGRTKRVDFGLTTQSGIYGVAFVDVNGNGLPDQNDHFIAGVKVLMDGKAAQATDSRGAYFFKNVMDGKHTLTIDMSALPAGYIPLVKVKSEVDVAEGTTYIFHIPLKYNPK
ncbi:MAG: pilus assembly protein N-terminal domain-containing protein [Candidatus Omnitrophota bacterium]